MLPLDFHTDVKAELLSIAYHYEELANGLGSQFLLAIKSSLLRIREFPSLYPIIREPFRRAIVSRFPFGVVYLVSASSVRVIAIYPLRSNPDDIERLITSRFS